MKYLALIIGIVMIVPVYGQRKKDEPVTPAFTEGVVYSLPSTGIRVKVKAVKETFIPGPYAVFADQLLGIKNVKNRPSVNWAIEEVEISYSFGRIKLKSIKNELGHQWEGSGKIVD